MRRFRLRVNNLARSAPEAPQTLGVTPTALEPAVEQSAKEGGPTPALSTYEGLARTFLARTTTVLVVSRVLTHDSSEDLTSGRITFWNSKSSMLSKT